MKFIPIALLASVGTTKWLSTQVAKGEVCKTSMREFKSHLSLW